MSRKWAKVVLNDIATKLGDGLHGTPKYSDEGEYHFINGSNLIAGRIVINEKTKRVDQSQYEKYKKTLSNRTILVSINGTIGNVAFYGDEKVVLGKSACYFNLIDEINKVFVRYVLESKIFQLYIEAYSTGTTIKNVSLKTMRDFTFNLPPLPEQKAIAHILGKLDDKIELNRQMNQTLEEMAQVLFKSWFVDFDPVFDNALSAEQAGLAAGNEIPEDLKAKAERRMLVPDEEKLITQNPELAKLFPSTFTFNETLDKWIPEGWEDDSIYKIMDITYGAPFASKLFNSNEEGLPIIRIRDLKTGTPQNWSKEVHPKRTLIEKGDLIVGMDAEFRPCLWYGENGYLNQRLFKASTKHEYISNFFIFYSLNPLLQFEEQAQVGTTVAHLGKKDIDKFRIMLPSKEILESFSNTLNSNFQLYINNFSQLKTLIQLRDTLLPQLISGKVLVPEGFVEEMAV